MNYIGDFCRILKCEGSRPQAIEKAAVCEAVAFLWLAFLFAAAALFLRFGFFFGGFFCGFTFFFQLLFAFLTFFF